MVFSSSSSKSSSNEGAVESTSGLVSESYWNEFDDDDREEPYTGLVRPSTAGSLDDDDPAAEQSLSALMLGPVARLFTRAHGGSRGASAISHR